MVILPPSFELLEQRLRNRGTETEETLKTRLGNAKSENDKFMAMRSIFQYRLVNHDLETSRRAFDTIIGGLYAKELGIGQTLRPVQRSVQGPAKWVLPAALAAGVVLGFAIGKLTSDM